MAQIFETAGRVAARTPYNTAFVAAIKGVEGRRWDAASKVWTVSKDQEPALRALVEQFFGAAPSAMPASPKEAAKNLADFADAEAYAWYFEGRVRDYIAALPATAYITLSLEALRADGSVIDPFDAPETPARIQGRVEPQTRPGMGGVYVSYLKEKGDIARMVMAELGEETTI